MRAHISEIFGAGGFAGMGHERDCPNASERIRSQPNASEQVQTRPRVSENFKKLAKTSRNFAKTLRKLRANFAIAAFVPSFFCRLDARLSRRLNVETNWTSIHPDVRTSGSSDVGDDDFNEITGPADAEGNDDDNSDSTN